MIYLTEFGGFSRPKKYGDVNQDSWLAPTRFRDGYVMAVADGVGAYDGSEMASSSVIDFISSMSQFEEFNVSEIIYGAWRAVKKISEDNPKNSDAATTLTVCFFSSKGIHVGHIGDCRAYILGEDRLIQITTDHTQHQRLLDERIYTRKELRGHGGEGALTSALSNNIDPIHQEIFLPLNQVNFYDGKVRIFLMSDGAHRIWSARSRLSISTLASPSKFVSSLRRRIDRVGAVDDNTIIVAEFAVAPWF